MKGCAKIVGLFLILFCSIDFQGREGFSQTAVQSGPDPVVKMGEIAFKVKEYPAAPSPLKMLEIQIEIINPSPKTTVPPNTVKVAVVLREALFPSSGTRNTFNPPPEEATLTMPMPPGAVRFVIIGFSLSQVKPESVSFEVQINPPDGEKKTATFHF